MISIRFGSKLVLGVSILIASVLTFLTPWLARIHYIPLIICRFVIGLCHVTIIKIKFCLFKIKKIYHRELFGHHPVDCGLIGLHKLKEVP